MIKTYVFETECGWCGNPSDQHTGFNDRPPAEGDLAICPNCWGVNIFTVTGRVITERKPNKEELAEISALPAVRRAIAALRESYTTLQAAQLLDLAP